MTLNLNPAARVLHDIEPLRRPIVQTILAALHIPDGSRGLDVANRIEAVARA